MSIDTANAVTFLLVMIRMTGMLVFNPILGRSNVPRQFLAGLALLLAVILTPGIPPADIENPHLLVMLVLSAKEMLFGILTGLVVRLFLSVIIIGGEIMDLQLGISMAKAFDPGTNASVSVTSSLLNVIFVIMFFVTNNHLTFISMTAQSLKILPVGTLSFNSGFYAYIPELFSQILVFAIKLCLPLAVIEIVVTVAVGIIMRVIPQINVFVINIQFKLLIGMFVLVTLVPALTGYMESLIYLSFDRIEEAWRTLF